jgi:hypothetical protein
MWPASTSTTMPSGKRQSVTMVLLTEPSVFMEWMCPAFSSSTKRRDTVALAAALRWFSLIASDMQHLCGALTRHRSELCRYGAAKSGCRIERNYHRKNDCVSTRCVEPTRIGHVLVVIWFLLRFERKREKRCSVVAWNRADLRRDAIA